MRLVVGVLALTLFASAVRAEGTAPGSARPSPRPASGKVPLRVVRVMPESHQALLFDRSRSTHVLVEVGGTVDGYAVEDIDDDEVTLAFQGKQIVLAAPARSSERRIGHPEAQVRSTSAARPADSAASDSTPVDPYGDPSTADNGPAAGEGGVRVVAAPTSPGPGSEPLTAGEGGIRVAKAPASSENPAAYVEASAARPLEPGDDGVRVVKAPEPSAPREAPTAVPIRSTSFASVAPSSQVPSSQAPVAGAPGAPTPAVPASTGQGTGATSPAASSQSTPSSIAQVAPGDAAMAAPGAPRAAAAQPPRPGTTRSATRASAAKRSPEDPSLSARAMADVLTGGAGARDGRKPGPSLSTASVPEPRADAGTSSVGPAQPTAAPASDAVVLSRSEVDAALADFGRLTAAIHGSFGASGVVIEGVSDGSLFQRAGLRPGDVIATVDGVRLRSLDDAANVYARVSTAAAITAQIVRGGKPMTLRVAIR